MGSAPSLPSISLDNPLVVDAATLNVRAQTEFAKAFGAAHLAPGQQAGQMLGILPTDQQIADAQKRVREQQYADEQNARNSEFQRALNDKSLDPTTQKELQSLYDSGASSVTIAALYGAALEGKGMYANRKMLNSESKLQADMPGRAALVAGNKKSFI